MNTHDEDTRDEETLRWQLRGLRRDLEPQADLWTGIAACIAATPREIAADKPRARRFAPWAMAASVLLAVGVVWQMMPAPQTQAPAGNPMIRQQAVSMALDYERAFARLQQQADTRPEMHGAFGELDRSAAQILSAIEADPNATFLLEQLRRTYARRLQLTQRAVMT